MYRVVIIVAACLFVAACSMNEIKKGMTALEGQPISAAIAKLGLPTDERIIAGQKVYIWFTSDVTRGTETKCQIRVIMKGEVIGSWDAEGNDSICKRYAMRFWKS